jgi:hypothetical protein
VVAGGINHREGRIYAVDPIRRSKSPDDPVRLYEVGPGVTDGRRRELDIPMLEEARKREAIMGRAFKVKRP